MPGLRLHRHLYDPLYSRQSYTHNFQIPLIYDAIEKADDRRHSVVVAQQAGLGMMNWKGSGLNTWRKWGWEMAAQPVKPDAFDESVRRMAIQELDRAALGKADPAGDFDLMVLYLAGLDENLHKGKTDDTAAYLTGTLDRLIGEIAEHAAARLKNTPIYALVVDHGHTKVDRAKHMDLKELGTSVRLGENGQMTWHDVLAPDETYIVSKKLEAGSEHANVIFAPAGGLAHVYVNTPGAEDPEQGWKTPPSLERLTPLVNNIHATKAAAAKFLPEGESAVKDILVRVPGPEGTFASSRYKVVRRDYKRVCLGKDTSCERTCGTGAELCTLENQLVDLRDLESFQPPPAKPEFAYAEPERRVNLEWASENGGDILILTDMEREYCFDKGPLPSTHGSLSYKDALVPLGFSYPGATSSLSAEDNVMELVIRLLEPGDGKDKDQPVNAPVERPAMEAALGRAP